MTSREHQKLIAHLKTAQNYADLSYAKRLRVGAVLIKDDRPISVGYNGTPSGLDNNCEEIKPIEARDYHRTDPIPPTNLEYVTKPEVCHAEMNAIAFAAAEGVATKGASLVTTHSPCFECAKLIIQSKIIAVYYQADYRDTAPLELLGRKNIKLERIEDVKEN